jgi:hypothetical protein
MKTTLAALLLGIMVSCNPASSLNEHKLLERPACLLYQGKTFIRLGMPLKEAEKIVDITHDVQKHGKITDSQYFIDNPYYEFTVPGSEVPLRGIVRFHMDDEEEKITGVYAVINTEDLHFGDNYDTVVSEAVKRYFPCFKGMEERIVSGELVSLTKDGMKQTMHVSTDAAPRKGRTLMYEAEYVE